MYRAGADLLLCTIPSTLFTAILADVNDLFLQLTTEIYNAYTNLSNLQGHTLAGVLVDISAHESEQGTLMILLPCSLHLPSRVVRAHAHTTLTDRRFFSLAHPRMRARARV